MRGRGVVPVLVALALLVLASPAPGYVPNTLDFVGGQAVVAHWPSSAFPIAMRVTRGLSTDVLGGDDRAALDAAMTTWSAVSDSAASIFVERETDVEANVFDGINAIEFSNDASLTGAQFVALTFMLTDANGEIIEADMLVNDLGTGFTTAEGSNVGLDMETAMLQEIGRFLGLSSSPVGTLDGNLIHEDSAVMFPLSRGIAESARVLRDDDIAGISALYPATGSSRGAVSGRVTRDGQGVFGAHVVVHEPIADILVGAVTLPDGSFTVAGLPPGTYVLEVLPLSALTPAATLGGIFATGEVDDTFTRAFAAQALRISAGQTISGVTVEVK